jgi:hypothetical protein
MLPLHSLDDDGLQRFGEADEFLVVVELAAVR